MQTRPSVTDEDGGICVERKPPLQAYEAILYAEGIQTLILPYLDGDGNDETHSFYGPNYTFAMF